MIELCAKITMVYAPGPNGVSSLNPLAANRAAPKALPTSGLAMFVAAAPSQIGVLLPGIRVAMDRVDARRLGRRSSPPPSPRLSRFCDVFWFWAGESTAHAWDGDGRGHRDPPHARIPVAGDYAVRVGDDVVGSGRQAARDQAEARVRSRRAP